MMTLPEVTQEEQPEKQLKDQRGEHRELQQKGQEQAKPPRDIHQDSASHAMNLSASSWLRTKSEETPPSGFSIDLSAATPPLKQVGPPDAASSPEDSPRSSCMSTDEASGLLMLSAQIPRHQPLRPRFPLDEAPSPESSSPRSLRSSESQATLQLMPSCKN